MNDQVILSVENKSGILVVTTRGTGNDQLNAIRAAAGATFRGLDAEHHLPEEQTAGVISAVVLDGIRQVMESDGMRKITIAWSGK